jgi:hypothetical protein
MRWVPFSRIRLHLGFSAVMQQLIATSQSNTTMVPGGMLTLDPPGATINLDDIYRKSGIG